MDESQLIIALQNHDEFAFSILVKRHEQMVFNTAMSMLQNIEDAEDTAQDVFIQVHGSIKDFKEEAKLSTWMYRITITKCLDRLRRNKTKKRFAVVQSLFGVRDEVKEPTNFYHPGVQLDDKERSAILFKAIARLPDNQKIAYTLNKVEGLSYQHIAEVMSTTVSAVESYMHRAKQHLKKYLSDFYK